MLYNSRNPIGQTLYNSTSQFSNLCNNKCLPNQCSSKFWYKLRIILVERIQYPRKPLLVKPVGYLRRKSKVRQNLPDKHQFLLRRIRRKASPLLLRDFGRTRHHIPYCLQLELEFLAEFELCPKFRQFGPSRQRSKCRPRQV